NKPKAPATERGGRPLVLPLRKVQSTFPSMITIGRTDNNDLVVPDEQVSKFHAFFRIVGDRVELSDAGSRNGTFVGNRRLESRGASAPVSPGDRCAFGAVEFQLFDARGCWEWLRQLDRFA
ncbi:MAG TPA: FHA domain-containing protein, partial [Polyangia bacterium]